MACYHNYLAHYHVSNWAVKQPTNKRTSKSSLHRPLDLDTPTSEESSASFDQLSIPTFKVGVYSMTDCLFISVYIKCNVKYKCYD